MTQAHEHTRYSNGGTGWPADDKPNRHYGLARWSRRGSRLTVPVQFKPGALFKVPAGDDYGYGVMLSQFPYMAFYGKSAVSDEQGLPVGRPLFVVLVTKAAYSTGRWGKPLRLLPENEIIPIPKF